MDLMAREEQLQGLARDRGLDWEGPLSDLPNDPRLRIAALATLLRIDPMEVLRTEVPVKRLEGDARKRQRANDEFERKERKFLKGAGLEIGEDV